MIRPEAASFLLRWLEPALVIGAMAIALSVVGAPRLTFGWVSLLLSVPIVIGGLVWLRAAVRRALAPTESEDLGKIFVEERRVLYVGAHGNVQFSFDETLRIELARSRTGRNALLFTLEEGPPVSVPLRAEGTENLVDALSGLTGFSAEKLAVERKRRAEALIALWVRSDALPRAVPPPR